MSDYKAVLIVEDDQDLAASMERSFLRRGYDAKAVGCVKDAILVIKNFHPCYAVVDLKMPGESGLELVKQLHEFDKSIKIIVLTGYASITTTIEAIKSGACYYLAKPANVDDIISAFDGKVESVNREPSNPKISIKNLERERIHQVLAECNFNISKAAKTLGMHRRTLTRKLEKRGVDVR